ncbi:MAG: NUDIX domain-containing protein [Devosia sp.]|uniref:NUDIX hydrolase n=1 Tax=Devosia sp. TaxID=1871048 RepID=UPI0024C6A415|nr:NUDIX domain-containing protein [Devosia sp.]UYN98121.1 MAG: NUDIX domain-containing protein [Devosia sp.]
MSRHMISFPIEGQRFNYRVAAIFMVDNHVLVCDEDDDGFSMLPGGRVELGEPSKLSLQREIVEEIGLAATVGDIALTSESFYRRMGYDMHELGLFYHARFDGGDGPDGKSPWRVTHEEDNEHRFHWVDLAGDGLEALNLQPVWLRAVLRNMPVALTHIVHDERAAR